MYNRSYNGNMSGIDYSKWDNIEVLCFFCVLSFLFIKGKKDDFHFPFFLLFFAYMQHILFILFLNQCYVMVQLSDDEGDCHPNIDKDSWFRMKVFFSFFPLSFFFIQSLPVFVNLFVCLFVCLIVYQHRARVEREEKEQEERNQLEAMNTRDYKRIRELNQKVERIQAFKGGDVSVLDDYPDVEFEEEEGTQSEIDELRKRIAVRFILILIFVIL